MCGFLFVKLRVPGDDIDFDQPCRFILRRGPSGRRLSNFYFNNSYSLNFVHYLLDVSGRSAFQPLTVPSTGAPRYTILFNGEIYNYKELCSGAPSDTHCLTELTLAYGPKFGGMLRGEYALFIYDHFNQEVHVCTDQFSTKPLAIGWNQNTGEFGVASYPSALRSIGLNETSFIPPNFSASFSLLDQKTWQLPNEIEYKSRSYLYNLEQHSFNFEAWESAFLSSVSSRALHGSLPIYVPLSSGYDSGAICLALNLLKIPYRTITIDSNENSTVLSERQIENRSRSCLESVVLPAITHEQKMKTRLDIEKNCEPFRYTHAELKLSDDDGALGAYVIAQTARKYGWNVCLSGCGADEITSDYGFGGAKFYLHSEFGGLFPESLQGFFPWKKFYGDTMRSYLFKDEFILGAHGIEGRYPFLDPVLTQAFLSLAPSMKNLEYKAPIAAFLRRHNYPFEMGVKRGFSP